MEVRPKQSVFKIPSANPLQPYLINLDAINCTCETFQLGSWCDHLKTVGKYSSNSKVNLSARPSFSQALSGLVKSIRLRDVDEAAYWLTYCWTFRNKLSGSQFRIVRRLLIGAAEDGHSVSVMLVSSENFRHLLAKDVDFALVMAELVRICKVPNWWQEDTGGHDYLYNGMLGYRRQLSNPDPISLHHCLQELEQAIILQLKPDAQFWVLKALECDYAGATIAHKLIELAKIKQCQPAYDLMRNIYMRHEYALRHDSNFICHAVWYLSGGISPIVNQIEPVDLKEVNDLIEKVSATSPYVIPGWCCDGVHCAGNDIRYAGMWERMYAVCNQYKHYGRVSPQDQWLEDLFFSTDGLEAANV